MSVEGPANILAVSSKVYSWEEFITLVDKYSTSVLQNWWLYLLACSYTREGSPEVQKVGITTNKTSRLIEHKSRGQRGEYGVGLWPVEDYTLTCSLGRVSKKECTEVEAECKTALVKISSKGAIVGAEWFEVSPFKAITAVAAVLHSRGLEVDINESVMGEVINAFNRKSR